MLGTTLYADCQLVVKQILKNLDSGENARYLSTKQETDTLQLPFWDDFSTSTDGSPNPGLWFQSENVYVNRTMAKNPPTLNIASFDGTDAFGVPYDINSQFVGNTDNLNSKPIDLSKIAANKMSTVFISFFWQAKGNGEIPNEDDSLRLQFMNSDSAWVTKFVVAGGIDAVRTNSAGEEVFTQEIIRVDDASFFHSGFRFRFQSFGRLKGGFDTWHVDYVLLNQDRNFADLSYFDRGVTGFTTSLLGEYSAVPSDMFFPDPNQLTTPIDFQLFNLDAIPHPVEYTISITNTLDGSLIDQPNFRETASTLSSLERRVIQSELPDLTSLNRADSTVIEAEIRYNTGDRNLIQFVNPASGDTTFYDNVDFKVNDTIRRQFTIQNYLSYDDGTAEFAAGINQIRGQLAYQFYLPTPDTLTDVDIYFPRIANSVESLPIEILVWTRLSDDVGSLIAKQPFTIQYQEGINNFTRYTLEIPLEVQDTIFIGWQQFSDNFIGVGLDKNTDAGRRIFANVDGEWRQNVGIEGSLMMRPVFRKLEREVVTSVSDATAPMLSIYPNPSRGTFYVEGTIREIDVFDLTGQRLQFKQLNNEITLSTAKPGIYIVRAKTPFGPVSRRIVIQ